MWAWMKPGGATVRAGFSGVSLGKSPVKGRPAHLEQGRQFLPARRLVFGKLFKIVIEFSLPAKDVPGPEPMIVIAAVNHADNGVITGAL